MTVGIVACVKPTPTTTATVAPESSAPTTTSPPSTTGTSLSVETASSTEAQSTTPLPPTTPAMNYCEETKGMNQPLTIQPGQVTSNPTPDNPSPSGDINPTTSPTSGLNFSSPTPQINITLDQPATITVIYVPTDRPEEPTTVIEFTVKFVLPNDTTRGPYSSVTPSTSGTTTTAPPSTGVVPPSDVSPQVELPPNFRVPEDTVVIITVTDTKNDSPATGVCIEFFKNILDTERTTFQRC